MRITNLMMGLVALVALSLGHGPCPVFALRRLFQTNGGQGGQTPRPSQTSLLCPIPTSSSPTNKII